MINKLQSIKLVLSGAIAFVLISFAISSDYSDKIQNNIKKLETFYKTHPQQKIFLHFDKKNYKAGEDAWYKAYVVDGKTNKPDTISTNLYVEIIDEENHIVEKEILRLNSGFAVADFRFSDSINEGNYQVRAYTAWMKNFDEEFFYKNYIQITNDDINCYKREDFLKYKKNAKNYAKGFNKINIQFFPEGGNLIEGLNSKVAFKVMNSNGKAVEIDGVIIDNKKNVITKVSTYHNGMGFFDLTPEVGEKYTFIFEDRIGNQNKKRIPLAQTHGYVMMVDNDNDNNKNIKINIKGKIHNSKDSKQRSVFLLAHTRGEICYSIEANLQHTVSNTLEASIVFADSLLSTGISHITLFDDYGEPQCERLIFVKHDDQIHLEVNSTKSSDSILIDIKATDNLGKPIVTNMSLTVIDTLKTKSDIYSSDNIYTSLLLTSDLKGKIEQPNFYFKDDKTDTRKALDILLMTHGWRRFVWQEILDNSTPKIKFMPEKGLSLNGSLVQTSLNDKSIGANVSLLIMDGSNDLYQTTTNSDGYFEFMNLYYLDTVSLQLSAKRIDGSKKLNITIHEKETLPSNYDIYNEISPTLINKWQTNKKQLSKTTPESKPDRIYGNADHVVHLNQLDVSGYSNVVDVIRGRVPGVNVVGNSIRIRGISTIYGSIDPLILIDGIAVSISSLFSISPNDVETIEVLSGPNASFFGSRGSNGVIAIYTRKGKMEKQDVKDYLLLGYYKAREFYKVRQNEMSLSNTMHDEATVFWLPEIVTNSTGNAKVKYKSDNNINHKIIIQGISLTGKIAIFD